jgi:hypothetical protein
MDYLKMAESKAAAPTTFPSSNWCPKEQDRKAKGAIQSRRAYLLKAIVVTFPLVNLVAVPVYIATRLVIKNRATRTTGCLAAFTVYVLLTVGFFDPSAYLLPGTIELFILVALVMLADFGLQVRALDVTG